ncbi:MAG: hypothetical protein SFW67_17870 [Myxococcaceae bacterium]|nr:hypothetical protein [Myxococcaceae bacterium]
MQSSRFEVSATYVAAVQRLLSAVAPALELDGPTRFALERPYARRWHPGAVALSVHAQLVRHAGDEALVDFERRLVVEGLAPMFRPAARVVYAHTRWPAEALLASVPVAAWLAVRGVLVDWDARASALTIRYPEPVDEVLASGAWRGAVRGLFELVGLEGPPLAWRFQQSALTLLLHSVSPPPTDFVAERQARR